MAKTRIFTEGNDIKLIKDLIAFLGKHSDSILFEKTEGWTKLPFVKNLFLENTNKGGTNLVIFDADNDIDQRRSEIMEIAKDLSISFHLFLFPNDNSIGCCENLLLNIIQPNFLDILNCFDSHSVCLNSLNKGYVLPTIKHKFYSFTSSTGQKTNINEIDFQNSTFFDLNSKALQPLTEFLSKHL